MIKKVKPNSEQDLRSNTISYIQQFSSYFFSRKVKKKELILKSGEVCDFMIYLKKGMLRIYFKSQDKEINTWFVEEDEFITSINSFHNGTPCHENIEALEDSEIFVMKKSTYNFILRNNHKFSLFNIDFLYVYLSENQNLCQMLRFMSAEQKYEHLIKNKPNIVNRISQKHLASFLGIETTYLSKIVANYK